MDPNSPPHSLRSTGTLEKFLRVKGLGFRVYCLGSLVGQLQITNTDVSGQQRVLINNPDDDGFIRLSKNSLSRLDATNTGVDVYGVFTTTGNADIGGNVTCVASTETSDAKLKENIKEINTKECYKAVKYIKPKTYNFIKDEDKKSNFGFIADDIKDAKMPKEWDNIIYYNHEGIKLLAYNKMSVVLWGGSSASNFRSYTCER